jgi:hypothetical protein
VLVEGRSRREVARLTGLARDTVAKAVASETPPKHVRASAGSKVDPFKDWICEQLQEDPTIQAQRLRELAAELGYEGGTTIFGDYVCEVRPQFQVRRTFQRTIHRPGSWCSAICGSRVSRSRSVTLRRAGAGAVTAEVC